jgi:hypothetical protein
VAGNGAISETVRDLIGGTTITLWNTEQPLHLTDIEVGHAPGAYLPCRSQVFKSCYKAGEISNPIWAMQQIEVQIISTQASESA